MSPRHWQILAALTLLALGGCSTDQAAVSMRSSWAGKRADEFFAQHGAAAKEQRLGDGRRVYIWISDANAPFGGPPVRCSADIVAAPDGRIISIRPREDTLGVWQLSRCSEIFGG